MLDNDHKRSAASVRRTCADSSPDAFRRCMGRHPSADRPPCVDEVAYWRDRVGLYRRHARLASGGCLFMGLLLVACVPLASETFFMVLSLITFVVLVVFSVLLVVSILDLRASRDFLRLERECADRLGGEAGR